MRVPAIPVDRFGRRVGRGKADPVEHVIILALVGGAALVLAVVARPPLVPIRITPVLVALAAACVIELTRRPAPNLAWLAAIAGAYAAATLPIDQARAADPGALGVGTWLTWAIPAATGAMITLWIATGYATRPGRRIDPLAVPVAGGLLGWFAVAIVTTIAAILTGQRTDPAFTWVDVATAPIATSASSS